LSAVTGGRYSEVTFEQGSQVVGRLPYVAARRGPFRILSMPAFTHLLGPVVDSGVGKHQTQLIRRLSITRALIDQLPSFAYFKQIFDTSIGGGLAIADGLAFQDRGFRVAPQYTFQIDCRNDLAAIWSDMHFKVRQHIRRAEKRYSVVAIEDPDLFTRSYLANVDRSGKINRIDFSQFPTLFSECQIRKCGEILSAIADDRSPAAMVYLVWGHGVMYYLLSTRDPKMADSGAVSLLLWSAIQRAHQRNLNFDLDGVYTSGTARFLSGFGGQIKVRLVVTRTQPIYRILQAAKAKMVSSDGNENFT
jgi:lipid II:glycine glycyltransferase (peptidoglycan interpeptide bridge formation enzyme)